MLPPQPPATRLCGGWQLLLVALLLGSGAVGRGETVAPLVPPAAEAQFEAQVRPLLMNRCQGCHGATKAESGLRLDSRASLLKGDDAGTVVGVGDPAASRLLTAIHRSGDSPMPPDEPLSAEEMAILEGWVAAGLPWSGPGAEGQPAAAGGAIDMEQRLREALVSHWSFAPPQRHVPPQLKAAVPWEKWTSPLDTAMYGPGTLDGMSPRRSIYLTVKRSQPIPFLQVFDQPEAIQSVGSRGTATVPTQALALMNAPFVRTAAEGLAARAKAAVGGGGEPAIAYAFRAVLSRSPAPAELEKFRALLQARELEAGSDETRRAAALADICQLMLCMNECVYID
ncbi:MAG: DUF1553 domain-containing protein [Planctomycetota bacterium]